MEEVQRICDEIVRLCRPEKVILFDRKNRVSTGEIKSISLCVIIAGQDKDEVEKKIYLEVDSPLSFTLIVYTLEQWDKLLEDDQSYARRIMQKGTLLYE